MSDIVKRLRTTGDPWPQYADVPLCVEAAAEIEHLQRELRRYFDLADRQQAEIERLQTENTYLRTVMQGYAARGDRAARLALEHNAPIIRKGTE
jgi:hypothetical protein